MALTGGTGTFPLGVGLAVAAESDPRACPDATCHGSRQGTAISCSDVTGDIVRPINGGDLVQRYVVFYESADDVMSRAPAVYPRHLARLKEFRDRGDLWLVGTFGDPQVEGSMAVFGSREAAEEFVSDDPFVSEGVVKAWTLREWDEVASEI